MKGVQLPLGRKNFQFCLLIIKMTLMFKLKNETKYLDN